MKSWICRCLLVAFFWLALPHRVPAPLIYRPGEGWTYEQVGGGKWTRTRAKDQLEVAQEAFDRKDYSLALKASRRVVRVWPISDYAPQAQYILARCYEAKGQDERAFKAYQDLVEKYPKSQNYEEVLRRQFEIANRFLGGQWFKLWGYVPFFPSMDKTSDMYTKIIKNGTYSEVAPQAQISIGAAREKQSDYAKAVKAYERAADLYFDNDTVAADALYKTALAYTKQAKTAEYDQHSASQAIETFNSFIALYPNDPRAGEAEKTIAELRTEQARGAYQVARFYEKRGQTSGALVYFNEVLNRDPGSRYATESRQRIEVLQRKSAREKERSEP